MYHLERKKRRSFKFSYLKKSLKHLYHSFNTSKNLRRRLGRTFGPPPLLRDSPGSRRTSLPPIRELNNISGLCWIDLIINFFSEQGSHVCGGHPVQLPERFGREVGQVPLLWREDAFLREFGQKGQDGSSRAPPHDCEVDESQDENLNN